MIENERIVDLHTHSNASDGTFTPTQLVLHAKELGLAAIALTDHDTVIGLPEAKRAAHLLDIEFITGMEITIFFQVEPNKPKRKIHVVALGFSVAHPSFKKFYKKLRGNKEDKMNDLIDGIRKRGVDISLEKVSEFATIDEETHKKKIDRYALIRCLVDMKIEKGIQPLWDKYIDPVVEEIGLQGDFTPAEVFQAIHEAGGITSLAHYHKKIGLGGLSRAEQERIIRLFRAQGLDGIECWYPSFSQDDKNFVRQLQMELGLIATGGTDFHGSNRVDVELGSGKNHDVHIPYSVWENIKKFIHPDK